MDILSRNTSPSGDVGTMSLTLLSMRLLAHHLIAPSTHVAQADIRKWETAHQLRLPADLVSFFVATDGLSVCWTGAFNGIVVQLGEFPFGLFVCAVYCPCS